MQSIESHNQKVNIMLFCAGQLKSTICQCGRNKQRGMAVCYLCWGKLPQPVRHALYRRVGAGFEEALRQAHELLADVPHRCADAPQWPEPIA